MYWANFLHIYQPPNQKSEMVKKVTRESYRKILQGLKENPKAKLTLNINACLTELLMKSGLEDVVLDIKDLAVRGQIELVESAKYHAFLPKIPKDEIKRQIELNHKVNKKYYGDGYNPKGFFPPEMAFSMDVAEVVESMGYEWMIVDEASLPGDPDYSKIYKVRGLKNMKLYFKERETSFRILSAQLASGSMLISDLGERLEKKEYLLTAMDGETFGHHRPGLEKLLFDIYKTKDLPTITISEIEKHFKEVVECDPVNASWALMHKDLARNTPFARWDDPDNKIHQMQWDLTYLAIDTVKKCGKKEEGYIIAREMLDKALHSDQYWWASAKPWWSLEIIEKGAKELQDTVFATPKTSKSVKEKAKELYQNIVFTALDWQREGVVEDMVREHYDEEITTRLDTSVPYISDKEFKEIEDHLRKQMLESAEIEEYEKAAQFNKYNRKFYKIYRD